MGIHRKTIIIILSLLSAALALSVYAAHETGAWLLWIAAGVFFLSLWSVILSVLVRRSVTEPIRKTIEDLKKVSESNGSVNDRREFSRGRETDYIADSFGKILESLRKRNEEKKRLLDRVIKSRLEWVATFDAIQDLISIHDRDDTIIKVNRAFAARFNARPEELIGKKCHELLYGTDAGKNGPCPHRKTQETGMIENIEVNDMVFGGSYQVITYPIFNRAGEVWAVVHIARDITEEKILKEQLLHSEKLSSIGKLVAGIAHELNNPLMGIMGYSQILMDMPDDKKIEEVKEKLGRIYHESMRTARIVQNLLTFARTRKAEKHHHDINAILRQTLELREYSLRTNNIEVVLNLKEKLPRTMVDLYQMQQVFINIINNAADAMVARSGKGRLEIGTDTRDGAIVITFRDNGPGIPKDIKNKVFDPFFTTKEVGKGTGLGLSITHGIVVEHGGRIDISSAEGEGTKVTVELPVMEKGAEKDTPKKKRIQRTELPRGKAVLIVDDEKSIREGLSDILTSEGFDVETARDGKEALEAMERKKFSLLIADLKMPGVDGKELYRSVMKRHNYMKDKVILLTGDVFSQDVKDFFRSTGCPYILKPFEPKDLVGLVREVLSPDPLDVDKLH